MATQDREKSFLMRTCTILRRVRPPGHRVDILTKMDSLTTEAQVDMPTVGHMTRKMG